VRRVARQFGLASSTVRAIDVRYLSQLRALVAFDQLAQSGSRQTASVERPVCPAVAAVIER
jgi:hypothetical protein